MKTMNNIYLKRIVFALQIITMSIFAFLAYTTHIFPNLYLGIGAVIFLILLGLEYYFILYKKDKHILTCCTQIVSLLLSITLIIGSNALYKFTKTVDLMTEDNFQKRALSVIVLEESDVRNYNQLSHHTLGCISNLDKKSTDYAIEEMKKDGKTFKTKDLADIKIAVDELYNKKVDAIILDESFRELIEAYKKDFTKETRVIHQLHKDEEAVSSKNVDVTTKPFLVYISGNDQYGDLSAVSRSDVNMLMAIHPETSQILLISIPRDTYYPLHTSQQYDKFTHSGLYGLQESIQTLEDIIKNDINYYARLNFTSFINVVDAIGGVEVYSPKSFITKIGKYPIKKGMNTLNAKQALGFVRERKSFSDGDFARGRNQQRMISAIIKKLCSPQILTSYSKILDSVSDSVETNMTSQEINSLIQLQLLKMPKWNIQTYQITGSTGSRPCYAAGNANASVVIPYEQSIQEAIQLLNDLKEGKEIQTQTGDLDKKQ